LTEQLDDGSASLRSRAELREILTRDPFFATQSAAVLSDLVDACEVVAVPGGTCVVRAGQSLDALLGVLHGALRLVRRDDDGLEHTIREIDRGELLGVSALLSQRPSPFEVFAIRDSTLLRLGRARFVALAEAHPSLILTLARLMSERTLDVLELFVGTARPSPGVRGNLALLSLSRDPALRATRDLFVEMVRAERTLTHVTAELVDHMLGAGAAAGDGAESTRVIAWLSDLERAVDVVLYECDARLPRWTARCRRQSDRLVVVAAAHHDFAAIARALAVGRPDGLARPIDLVLVHPASTRIPQGTRAWSALPELRAIHHVRSGDRSDVARLVRRLVGRPTGLVLSGGGARGIAHVGVIAAIVEAGIPIDYVCGTSMGAIFAASLALGFDVARMRRELRELFARPFALYDLTLPISSLLAGKKLSQVLHRQLGDADIEDLWRPFFCVSTDLSQAQLVVHERGSLWQSVRASCSIPGIFPPLPLAGRMLVDGGLVDNLPLDLLVERCAGPIIAVDVFPYGDPSFTEPSGRIAAALRRLRTALRGEPASPPLFDILVRATLVGSKVRQEVAMARAETIVYLEPPVARFGALQWRAHEALFEAGYRYAGEQLARHGRLFARD
jgi:predicted acylesterase/phospholipase RssA/CRP-like cAMP-binding protein